MIDKDDRIIVSYYFFGVIVFLFWVLIIDTNKNFINDSAEGMKIIFTLMPFGFIATNETIKQIKNIRNKKTEMQKKQIILFYISLGIFIISILMFIVKIIISFAKQQVTIIIYKETLMKNKTRQHLTGIVAVIIITIMILLGYNITKNNNKIKATNPLPKAS